MRAHRTDRPGRYRRNRRRSRLSKSPNRAPGSSRERRRSRRSAGWRLGLDLLVIVPHVKVAAEPRPVIARRSRPPARRAPARTLSQNSTAQTPSFSRTWSEPVPALSSPQSAIRPASSRLPKYFQPVGVSKHAMPSCRGDAVDRAAGRHRARDAGKPLLEPRDELRIGGEDRQAVARPDGADCAGDDHVAVAVAVRRGAEIGRLRRGQRRDQRGGMGRVRVGVTAAEIGHAVRHGRRCRRARRAGARRSRAHKGR